MNEWVEGMEDHDCENVVNVDEDVEIADEESELGRERDAKTDY